MTSKIHPEEARQTALRSLTKLAEDSTCKVMLTAAQLQPDYAPAEDRKDTENSGRRPQTTRQAQSDRRAPVFEPGGAAAS